MPKIPPRPTAPRRERDVQSEVRAYLASQRGVAHWRNTVGLVLAGTLVERTIAYGLCPGSADLIACVPTALRCPSCAAPLPPVGRFVGVEVKGPHSRTSEEQTAWGRVVEGAHGTYGIVHAAEDAAGVIHLARTTW